MPAALAFVSGAIGIGASPAIGSALFGSWVAGVGFAGSTIGGSILSLAGSLLLSTAASALLARAPDQADMNRKLAYPTTLPQKRFMYGEFRATGTPIAHPVRGDFIYGCWLLNSRPSDMPDFKLYLDKREVVLAGDAFDFSLSGGAVATSEPLEGHCKFWIGRGDQTSPPAEILAKAPWAAGPDDELFKATDAGTGTTIIWAMLNRGSNNNRQERWPSTPPLFEVEGRYSKVWDMRDVAQDPDDESTWEWSSNQALCTLDALRTNPFRPYGLNNLMLPLWEDAADAADDAIALKVGGVEPRYRLGGTLIFNGSEIEDLVTPMLQAGASRAVRVGGKLGIVPGIWQAPVYTLSNLLGDRNFSDMKPGGQIPNKMQVTYTAADRGFESAHLKPWAIPDAPGGLSNVRTMNLTWVTSPSQAMRVRNIEGRRAVQQRALSGVAPPDAFTLIGGSVVTGDFPSPYGAVHDGTYEVETVHPGLSPQGEAGGEVALRCPVSLISTSEAIYAWDAATDEEEVAAYVYDGVRAGINPPGELTTTTGSAVSTNTGSGFVPAIRFAFDPSTSGRTLVYEWQFKVGAGDWTAGGNIDSNIRDGADQVFGFLTPANLGGVYDIRVRAVAGGSSSDWVSATETATLDVPRYTADFENGAYQIDGVSAGLGSLVGVTRASTATYVTSGGLVATAAIDTPRIDHATGVPCLLVESAGGNAFTYSEDVTDSAWIRLGISVADDDGTAPDGTATADRIIESGGSGTHYFRRTRSFTVGVRCEFSAYLKAAGRTVVWMRGDGTGMSRQNVEIDLTTGVASVTAGAPDFTVTALDDDWYRLQISFVPDASVTGAFYLFLTNGTTSSYTGDGVSGAYVWGMQDGEGSYCPTSASVGVREADDPRMLGITATLDVIATYSDATTAAIGSAPVIPGYWPALTKSRLRSLIGSI